MTPGPLDGLRVLDLTHHVAGPYCTKLLADYGAAGVRVERPGEGDPSRRMGPFPKDEPHPERSGLYLYYNTNKKGITLNLKTETGRQLFLELVKLFDVVVENFEPRVMPGLGLSYNELRKVNPRLLMTSISNFGQTGPYRDWRAEDITLYAMGGLLYINGMPEREPLKAVGNQAQLQAGLNAAVATLTGVMAQKTTGEGQYIDVSIQESIVSIIGETFMTYTHAGVISTRSGNRQSSGHPMTLLPCKNGYVAVVAGREDNYRDLIELSGLEELKQPKFATSQLRRQNADEFDAVLAKYLMKHTKEEILRDSQDKRLPFGMVITPGELATDPHYSARKFVVDIDHPETGPIPYPSTAMKWSRTPWKAGRAPLHGEHNEEIYCGLLGLAREDLVRLREQDVI